MYRRQLPVNTTNYQARPKPMAIVADVSILCRDTAQNDFGGIIPQYCSLSGVYGALKGSTAIVDRARFPMSYCYTPCKELFQISLGSSHE